MHGLHLLADLSGCTDPHALMADATRLAAQLRAAVSGAGLHEVGSAFHAFGPGSGVTGVVLLAESHVAIHTWPERAAVTFDIYVCNARADNAAAARSLLGALSRLLGAGGVHCREVARLDLAAQPAVLPARVPEHLNT